MVLRQSAWQVLLLWSACGTAAAQAIDCHRVDLSHSETAVCASTSLRELDASVSRRYAQLVTDPRASLTQRAWLQLRDRCNGNTLCLTSSYRDRSALLSRIPVAPPPIARVAVASTTAPSIFAPRSPMQALLPQPALPLSRPTENPSDQLNRAAGPMRAESKPPGLKLLWFLGGMLLAEVLLWKMLTNLCGKCPHCHHWFTRVELDRIIQADNASALPLLRRRRLRKQALIPSGESPSFTRSQTIAVRRHNQCSLCLHEWETTSRESR